MNAFITKTKATGLSILTLFFAAMLAGFGLIALGVLAAFALAAFGIALIAGPFLGSSTQTEATS